nr:MAG TPA: hypothetical protein [Caudoviricetes sp.]
MNEYCRYSRRNSNRWMGISLFLAILLNNA